MILGHEAGLAIAAILAFFPWYDLRNPAVSSLHREGAKAVDLIQNEQAALGGSSSSRIDLMESAVHRVRLLALGSVAFASLALLLTPRKRAPRLACGAAIAGAAGIASIMFGELRDRSLPRSWRWQHPHPDATALLVEAAPFLFALIPLLGLFLRRPWTRGTLFVFVPVLGVLSLMTLPSRSWLGDDFVQWGPRAVGALLAVALLVEGTAPDLLKPPATDPAEP
jgi:hypothetical protein